jgi:hypothetical protein
MEEKEEDTNVAFFIPSDLMEDDPFTSSEPMDIPSVGNSKYFSFAPVRKHHHPTNPNTNGLISSRILPDGSNTIRFTTALTSDFEVPEKPDESAMHRMQSDSFYEEYRDRDKKPEVLSHGEVFLSWKE